jgi:hypothetical protein
MSEPPAATPAPEPDAAAKPTALAVELPANLDPVYANTTIITHSASEIIIDLARVMPHFPKAKVATRIVMTPLNAKLFMRALSENLAKYEGAYGEIRVPEGLSLADRLFKPPTTK